MATQERKGQEIEVARPKRALSPFEEMDQMFEDFFPRGWMRPWPWRWGRQAWGELPAPFEGRMPSIDVLDREDEIAIRAELPAVDKKDLDVSISDNSVTIKASTRREAKEEKGDYYRAEISQGAFARTVVLPAAVDTGRAKATFKDGLLELTLPKFEKSKRCSITIE